MFFEPRKWRPTQKDSLSNSTDLVHKELSIEKLGMLHVCLDSGTEEIIYRKIRCVRYGDY